jgi:glutathione S-transferase
MNTERYLLEFTRDVEAIAFLVEESQRKGNKYLFGNTPTSADCFLFGVVACNAPHAKNITVNTSAVDIMTTHPALVKFCKDFEAEIYPDLNTISPCGVTSQSFA